MQLLQSNWFIQVLLKITRLLLTNVIILLILMSSGFCQSSTNYLQITSNVTNFNLSTAASLESIQSQTDAFNIAITSRYNNYYVSARISNYSSSSGAYLTETMLAIKIRTVSPSRSFNTNTIYLSGYDQQIFSGTSTGNQAYTYYYNMLFGPIGYDFPPGTYNATILFTMTQP